MSIFDTFTNVAKAGVAVAATPVALVVDVVTLPVSAYDDKHPFRVTKRMLGVANDCIDEATQPAQNTPAKAGD